jgi:hypothetical protein
VKAYAVAVTRITTGVNCLGVQTISLADSISAFYPLALMLALQQRCPEK